MPRKKVGQEFQITYGIKLVVGESVVAQTLEEALVVGRARKPHEVVDVDGLEYIDGEIEVTGVYG